MKNEVYKLSDNIFVVSDFEIIKNKLFGINESNLNYFLELSIYSISKLKIARLNYNN